jgi:hypothetical protein
LNGKFWTHQDPKRWGRWRAKLKHTHNFLWYPGDCSQRPCPDRSGTQFRILLWCFTATAWKCEKTSPKTVAILTQLRWSRQNHRQCWTPSQNTGYKMHFKNGRRTGMMQMYGREPLQGWWWPLGPKLVFDHMTAPVPEIMVSSGMLSLSRICSSGDRIINECQIVHAMSNEWCALKIRCMSHVYQQAWLWLWSRYILWTRNFGLSF